MFGGSRKDELFYGAFREGAQAMLDAAGKFAGLLDDLASAERIVTAIGDDRQRGEVTLRRTIRELHGTWITPLDRHHIHELILGIDGVLGLVASTARRVLLFRITSVRAEAKDLARIVTEACRRVRAVTDLLPKLSGKGNPDEVLRLAGEILEIEGSSGQIHGRALATLFDGSTEPLEVMKWREILDNLESAASSCGDVAKLFEAIVLENA
jgi:hypothetical protein